jgi:hypothetical protein
MDDITMYNVGHSKQDLDDFLEDLLSEGIEGDVFKGIPKRHTGTLRTPRSVSGQRSVHSNERDRGITPRYHRNLGTMSRYKSVYLMGCPTEPTILFSRTYVT